MIQRPFGQTGTTLPIIGQGTWYLENAGDAVQTLRLGIDLGMTHIDTAEMYGSGKAEAVVGKAIAGCRDEVYLVSKVLPSNASKAGTIAACERSLRALGTDHLDLYLLHWPGSHPLAETVAAFEALKASGKIRAFGVSNFDVDDLEGLASVTDSTNIACNQVLYNPLERTIENRVIPWCRDRAIPIVAYSPFGHGDLPGADDPDGAILHEIASAHGMSAWQVALAFVTRDPDVFTIPKAANPAHLRDNALAGELVLSADERSALEAALPTAPYGAHLPML
jgi:diketogulonate reductase-like aldo/keto reductase